MAATDDFHDLMNVAMRVQQRMRECEAALGLTFPLHVRFATGLTIIEAGLAVNELLEVAVGYLMLREVMDQIRQEQASLN